MLLVRRVRGKSMEPFLYGGSIIVAKKHRTKLRVGNVVIVEHENREKIKRIVKIRSDAIYVHGDNPAFSTDSRSFGWIPKRLIVGVLLWPLHIRKSTIESH